MKGTKKLKAGTLPNTRTEISYPPLHYGPVGALKMVIQVVLNSQKKNGETKGLVGLCF